MNGGGGCSIVTDTGTFTGSVAAQTGLLDVYVVSPIDVVSSLYGAYTETSTQQDVANGQNLLITNPYGSSGEYSDVGYYATNTAGFLGYCRIFWNTGPLAGQPGTVSTGTGYWVEQIGNSGTTYPQGLFSSDPNEAYCSATAQ